MNLLKIFSVSTILFFGCSVSAQGLKTPPSGGNKKAFVGERIGITDVTINYDRPGVKGREGKIYGTPIVHTGYTDLSVSYGTAKNAPWRAGANENTTIEFSTDVKIEGKDLAAGKYGFFVAYDPNECTVIFSKNNVSWGSYFYNESEDVLRVKVKPIALDKSVEWLKYDFINQTDNAATIALQWEKLMIAFKVEVDLVKTQLASFRQELRGSLGFRWESWQQAAYFCVQNNTNFDEGLIWANTALAAQKDFQTLSTKAMILEKLNKNSTADSLMKAALPMGSMTDLHQYGKKLLSLKRNADAMEVFKFNAKKNPKQFTTYVGLARGYSGIADFKTALVNARAALPLAPDPLNKNSVEGMIKKLETGKDIN
jgi:hypothetical protein